MAGSSGAWSQRNTLWRWENSLIWIQSRRVYVPCRGIMNRVNHGLIKNLRLNECSLTTLTRIWLITVASYLCFRAAYTSTQFSMVEEGKDLCFKDSHWWYIFWPLYKQVRMNDDSVCIHVLFRFLFIFYQPYVNEKHSHIHTKCFHIIYTYTFTFQEWRTQLLCRPQLSYLCWIQMWRLLWGLNGSCSEWILFSPQEPGAKTLSAFFMALTRRPAGEHQWWWNLSRSSFCVMLTGTFQLEGTVKEQQKVKNIALGTSWMACCSITGHQMHTHSQTWVLIHTNW